MPALRVVFDPHLKAEYETLFKTAVVSEQGKHYAGPVVKRILAGKSRYEAVAKVIGCPWWFVGAIHHMEASNDFNKHIHNGDPLSKKTTHVPAGRPAGNPPWTWEESAIDAFSVCMHFDKWHDWSIAGALWQFERMNGLGYRQYHPSVKSPYLWSLSSCYTKGKYSSDGHFDPNLVSQQLGVAVVLKELFASGIATDPSKSNSK